MARSLVIVESPAKAKTINKYLGKEYIVKSSVGHVRDLPTSGSGRAKTAAAKTAAAKKKTAKKVKLTPEEKAKKNYRALINRLGVDPEDNWKPQYEILPGKEKVVKELQDLADKADKIILATDLDREGEAIAWHLKEALGGDETRYERVVFGEITKKAIQAAFKEPGKINENRVNAQQARRFLDRVVGYMVSPVLWKKVARGLSAGRVQSVATRLIADREKEIKAFLPDEYWEVHTLLESQTLRAKVTKYDGEAFKPTNEKETTTAVNELNGQEFLLKKRDDKRKQAKPTAPFITSTLQQAASQRLYFGVKKTMTLAQRLYEAGHITYMRTDSTHLSGESLEIARKLIESTYGPKYLPAEANVYASKEGAQEAHEAIRPSNPEVLPEQLESELEPDVFKLYDLIWRRFVACQMAPAEFDTTTFVISAGKFEARCSGRIMRFDGFRRVLPPAGKKGEDDVSLPDIKQGSTLSLDEVVPTQHFTKPPPRFSEAKLVSELEKKGIGRPSTYASIISTIQDRGYVRVEGRRFFALKMGEIVTDRLMQSFDDLMEYSFTAKMEERFDEIAQGSLDWKQVLDNFYEAFREKLDHAEEHMSPSDPTPTDISCTACGRDMTIRTGTTGVFLGCSGYALPPKERCKETVNLVPAEEFKEASEDDDEQEVDELRAKKRCPKCESAMDSYIIDEERKLHVCGNNPDCDGFVVEKGTFVLKGYEGPIIECDKCGSNMELKTGRFGKYFGCTAYPECKNTRKLLRNGEAAPPRADPIHCPELPCEKSDGYFILRDGAAGMFLASSNFPRSRETKKPQVEDLSRHRHELDPKFHYLADGPEKDPDGNPYLVRFARKTKEYFLGSELDGKATRWKAVWDGRKWNTEETKKASKKKAAKKKAAKKKTAKKKVSKKSESDSEE